MTDPAQARLTPLTRGFRLYFWSLLLSHVGTWLHNIAAILLVYELSGSVFAVGLVNVAQFAFFVLLGPWSGALADRVGPFLLLIPAQLGSAVAAAALLFAYEVAAVTESDIIIATLAIGAGSALSVPAKHVLLPLMVSEQQLAAAIALQSVAFNAARAVGPAIGAMLVVSVGYSTAFAANMVSFLIFSVALGVVRRGLSRPEDSTRASSGRRGFLWVAGQLCRQRGTMQLLVAVFLVGMAIEPILTLAPAFAERSPWGPAFAGWLLSAFGVGTLLGGAVAVRFGAAGTKLKRARIGSATLGLSMILLSALPITAWSLVAAGIGGAAYLAATSDMTARMHELTPSSWKGRGLALWSIAFLGGRPFGSVLTGGLGDGLSPEIAGVIVGGFGLAACTLLYMERVRRCGR